MWQQEVTASKKLNFFFSSQIIQFSNCLYNTILYESLKYDFSRKSKPKWTYQDAVKLAGGDLTVAGSQTEDDTLHMASYIRYPDRCFDRRDSLARTIKVLNQELQLWPQPSVNLLKEHYEKSNLSTDKQLEFDALRSCSIKILIYPFY